MADISQEIKHFISNRLAGGGTEIDTEKSLFKEGIVDSFGLIELALFLKSKYGVDIDEYCIINNGLESISQIAQYVKEKQEV